MKLFFPVLLMTLSLSARAYVPTVEGLFRHGKNPEVTTNAMVLTASVTSYNPYAEKDEKPGSPLWVKWVYNVTPDGNLKLTQLVYSSAAMTEAALVDKVYVPELSPRSFAANQVDRGLLMAVYNSILINDGSFMIDFLQGQGVSVTANTEILNQDKIALLTRHRQWLAQNKGGRPGDESPMNPTNPAERERVSRLMHSPMYGDFGKVSLSRYQGEPAWNIKTDKFEAFIDDAKREIRQIVLRESTGEAEVVCREPMLLNGTHSVPKQIIFKTALDQYYQINMVALRHFNESNADMLTRLHRYDKVLGARQQQAQVDKPSFLY